MSKHFRPWNIDQTLLLPPNVRDFVPKDHVSRFIVGLVRESLDLKAIMCSYVSGLGQPPFDPRMMVSLLLHGYASGLYSSRRIARACCERIARHLVFRQRKHSSYIWPGEVGYGLVFARHWTDSGVSNSASANQCKG